MFTFLTLDQVHHLKMMKLPMVSVADLEDPFISNRRVDHMQPEQVPLSDLEFAEGLKGVYEGLEPHIKSMVSWDYYLQQAKQNREKFEPMLQTQNAPQGKSLPNPNDYKSVHCLRLFERIDEEGVWSRFGHDAIALELDVQSPFFQDAHYNRKPQLFKPVVYDDLRPNPPSQKDPFPAAFTRSQHLAFEKEWRLLRPSLKDSLVAIPKGIVKGIYVGLDCPGNVTQNMIELVKRDLQFRHIPLWQMAVSETHLRLSPVSLAKYVH